MSDNKTDITVIQIPTYVDFTCPHCDEDIEMDYDDFNNMMCSYYWGEWVQEEFTCPGCGETIEVNDVECD